MTISVTRLAPCFAARIDGADIVQPVAESAWGEIRAALQRTTISGDPAELAGSTIG